MKRLFLLSLSVFLLCPFFKGYTQTTTFTYTGGTQTYTVPAAVTSLLVDVIGAQGGGVECAIGSYQSRGGCGGRVRATIAVNPGDVLTITVGGGGGSGGAAGYGGGGRDNIYTALFPGAGGGGASRIVNTTLGGTILAVAGGGGGGGGDFCASYGILTAAGDGGGNGGGLTGAAGNSNVCGLGLGGRGGTPTAGGAGGTCAFAALSGGFGVGANCTAAAGDGSGGGGGGYYGGGAGDEGSGGGGGSSYTNPTYATAITHTQGYNCGAGTTINDGSVVITVACTVLPITGTGAICVGGTLTLSDGTAGGTWNSGSPATASITAGGLVTGLAAGNATISYTSPTGCVATTIVTVSTTPAAIVTTGVTCVGSTITLTDPVGGGVWTSSATGVATIVGGTGVLTGVAVGTTTITNTIGVCYKTTVVTVNPAPAGITGATSLCAGLTTPLGNTVTGGTWTSSNTATATIIAGTGVLSAVATGTTVITYTLPGGCITTLVFTVNTVPAAISGSGITCVGSSITLSDGTAGGTWSSSNTAAATIISGTGVLTGAGAGTTTITYTLGGTCTATTIVSVSPIPAAITGPSTVCPGTTITLANTTAGGAWTSSNTAAATISAAGVVTGVAFGTTTISYTTLSCNPVTKIITVNPLPAAISMPALVCSGVSATLTDASGGGTWLSGNTSVAIIGLSTGGVTPITAGTSIITYTLPTSCSITGILTVNPSPVGISAVTTAVCAGYSITLTDGSAGGTWSSSNTATGSVTLTTGVVTGVAAGTATITYTLPAGCTATLGILVNPVPAPVVGSTSLCTGLSTPFGDITSAGIWISSNPSVAALISGAGVVTGLSAGTATISYVVGTGCYADVVVTVYPSPPAITGTLNVCVGSADPLGDPITGGTWASSNTSVGTIDSTTGIVTGISASTTTITYTLATGCNATTTFTVNPLPLPITGSGSMCEGSGTVLADASGGGTWMSGNTAVANIGAVNGVVTGGVYGTAIITYTLPVTGCTTTTIVSVSPNPAPIVGPAILCVGSITTMTDVTPSGSWTSNAPGIASIAPASGVLGGISSGTAMITYTLPTTCYATTSIFINTAPSAISGTDSVCVGSSITLSDVVPGGTWSVTPVTGTASVIPATGVVSGISAGVVVISYTTAACSPATHPVTVNPLPQPITGIGTVCVGGTISLHEITTGGTWSTSNPAVGVTSTGLVSGLSAGSAATVSYTLPTGCYATAPVLVDYIPAPIHGIDSVCLGSSTILTDSSTGGVWSSSDGTIATAVAFTGEVIGVHSGTVHITYSFISGCYVDTVFKVITPLPASLSVTTNAADSVCAGTSVLFTAHPVNGGPGASFTWKVFLPGGPSGTGLTFPYAPTHWDYVECTMVPGGICALPDTVKAAVTMNVFPDVTPVVTISSNLPNDTITYLGELVTFHSDITSGGVSPSYQWYKNGIAIPGATSTSYSTHVYNVNDTFQLKVVATSYCDPALTQFSNGIIIYSNSYLAVKTVLSANGTLSLYPNPNNGSFTLTGKSSSDKEMDIEVADMLGRIVYTGKTTPVSGIIHAEIALPGEAADGTYMLRVHSETETGVFHFVIGK